MDYSLFVVIEKKDFNNNRTLAEDLDIQTREIFFGDQFDLAAKHQFTNMTKTVHISIIDYLQEWNLNKKCERILKTMVLLKDGKNLSAIEPVQYAKRFTAFMEQKVFAIKYKD